MPTNLAGTQLPPGTGGVVYPSPTEWPVTVHEITNITKARQATITAPSHGIVLTSQENTPSVNFSQVKGMFQINGQSAFVTSVLNANNFTVALDTSQYTAYTSGGFINVLTGQPPIDPFQNTFP